MNRLTRLRFARAVLLAVSGAALVAAPAVAGGGLSAGEGGDATTTSQAASTSGGATTQDGTTTTENGTTTTQGAGTATQPVARPSRGQLGYRTLRRGSRGSDVRALQRALSKVGFRTSADGQFGRRTEVSVRRWERKKRMRVNGVVTRPEGRKLAAEASTQRTQPQPPAEPQPAPTDEQRQLAQANGAKYVFPIRGRHSYGTSINRFGAPRGGRSHQGQDVFAETGTPLVAVTAGKVRHTGSGGGAGNYVVISGDDGYDYVYMHMVSAAVVARDQRVTPGQLVGRVGCTGSCSGSHLHFEAWTAHWWDGGAAFDPLPKLKEWDAQS
jgi:murein DD-endopeptidase MepM/ murein hydrolase activator NlpD